MSSIVPFIVAHGVEDTVTQRTRLAVAFLAVAGGPVALAAVFVRGVALAAMAALAALLAAAATWWLVRSHNRRVIELAGAADRVADGDLTVRVTPATTSADELGQLAAAFNRMTQRTQAYVRALTASRDQLRRHLAVLGDTLSSTHDLDRILPVILRTALAATGARSGAVLLLDQSSATLAGLLATDDEMAPVPIRVPLGTGLLGMVAATGAARRGRVATDGVALHEAEPRCRTYVVVPISAPGGAMPQVAPWPPAAPAPPAASDKTAVRGVLALYDRLGGDEFDDTDLVTLQTFAGQTAVAVNNVRTHQEAQRLSMTDPLTGLWNYRYLQESMRREVERASRFSHNLAVLALDLDLFKDVNDAYGHPAGDEVLVEFSRRISRATREVDLAFRQGGEEFVVLLPETDAAGATVLAQRLGTAVRDEPVVIAPRAELVLPSMETPGRLSIGITVSIGIAVYPDHGLTPQAVLDAADDALYAAKAAGRDTYRVATVAPAPVAAAELPVRAAARSPEDDLPQAGGPPVSPPGGPPVSPPTSSPGRAPGGARAPRQSRNG